MKTSKSIAKTSDQTIAKHETDKEFNETQEIAIEAFDETKLRHRVGIGFAVVGLLAIIGAIFFAIFGLGNIKELAKDLAAFVFVGLLCAHAVVSIAIVWFGYQALRAAERMFVPRRLMNDSRGAEVIRAIVGIDAPTTAVAKQLEEASKQVMDMAKSIVEIAGKAKNGGTKE